MGNKSYKYIDGFRDMANLAKKHFQGIKEGKSYLKTTELLFDKVFGSKRKFGRDFATEDGVVCSSSLEITYDGTVKKYSNLTQRDEYLKEASSATDAIVVGTTKGTKKNIRIKYTKIIKTEEFGGKPVGSKKESKGTIFEKEFTTRLLECINGKVCKGKYHHPAGYLIGELEKDNGPVVNIKNVGGANASRPFEVSGKQGYIAPNDHKKHGVILSDVTAFHKNGKTTPLSLKYGGTLTFMNPGSKTLFTDNDIKNKKLPTKGKTLLNMFGIDEDTFCDVFNKYGKKTFKSIVTKPNTGIIQKFLKTAMGSNYWMVHAHSSGEQIDMWWMKPTDVASSYSTISGPVTVFYGGKNGTSKRVDVAFSNKYFEFKLNIRNKGGGTYPTNIMLDYKTLSIKGKTTL